MKFLRRRQDSGWTSHEDENRRSPWQRITEALAEQTASARGQLRSLWGTRQGISDMIVSSGEILAEGAQTPFGRVIVAVCALTGAWLLL